MVIGGSPMGIPQMLARQRAGVQSAMPVLVVLDCSDRVTGSEGEAGARGGFSWEGVSWLTERPRLRLLLKGVQSAMPVLVVLGPQERCRRDGILTSATPTGASKSCQRQSDNETAL